MREHLETAAKWDPSAAERLVGPRFPRELGYLWEWSLDLHGRSGVGFDIAPLSYATIRGWADMSGERPTWREVRALMSVDRALRSGGGPAKAATEPDLQTSEEAWT